MLRLLFTSKISLAITSAGFGAVTCALLLVPLSMNTLMLFFCLSYVLLALVLVNLLFPPINYDDSDDDHDPDAFKRLPFEGNDDWEQTKDDYDPIDPCKPRSNKYAVFDPTPAKVGKPKLITDQGDRIENGSTVNLPTNIRAIPPKR